MLAHNIQPSQTVQPSRSKKRIPIAEVLVGVLAIFLILTFGFWLWYRGAVNNPNSGLSSEQSFVIQKGEGLGKISTDLKQQNLISSVLAFELYTKLQGISGSIQAGEYKIAANLSIKDLAQIITVGKVAVNKITIPEGWDIDQIGNYLGAHTTITKAQFVAAAVYEPSRDKYSWLSGLSAGQSLEGFLYPDTYQISLKPTANEVVEKMLANFDRKFTTSDRATLKNSKLSEYQAITLASIVEDEVVSTTDRKLVAGVFLNRLNAGMPLESDATIAYFLHTGSARLTYAQTQTPSPYNTYLNVGLPPTPLGNPSIDSIRAVLNPTNSNYLYFISVGTKTYYAQTLAEHNANIAKYLGN